MSVEIPLTQGYVAIVDDCDADLAEFKWSVRIGASGIVYAVGNVSPAVKYTAMHRIVLERIEGRPLLRSELTDHINNTGTDNRRGNLRACSAAENSRNRKASSRNLSGLKGVRTTGQRINPFAAQITVNGKQIALGGYNTAEEAHAAYVAAAIHYFGPYANNGERSLLQEATAPALNQLPLFDMEIAS
jgi:hypothetical protein